MISDADLPMTIPRAIRQLLAVVQALRQRYPKKRFTLDGRLVGDLGEALAEENYDLELFDRVQKHHDARASDGRLVQIKATMQSSLTFPVDHVPDYYLGIQIHTDGNFTEVFNGPGRIARETVSSRKPTKTNLHCVPIAALKIANSRVTEQERIPRRQVHRL